MLDRLERYRHHTPLTAAVAVYNRAGSLEIVASALCWTGFQAPFCSSEEAQQEWNEDNRDRRTGLSVWCTLRPR
jgi:transposase